MDELGLGVQIVTQLRGAQHEVVEVTLGNSFRRIGKDRYEIQPGSRTDYDALLWEMQKRGRQPQKIMHLWSVLRKSSDVSVDEALELSFFSLLNLAQTLADNSVNGVDVAIISSSLQSVAGDQILTPARAALLGPATVIPKELPNVVCRSIDCDPAGQGTAYVAVQIINEHCSPFQDSVVAFRGKHRFAQSVEAMALGGTGSNGKLKKEGVYLITGGLGKTGIAVASFLGRNCGARLVMFDKKEAPDSRQWKDELQDEKTPAARKDIIRQLLAIQELCGEISVVRGDVTKKTDVERAVALAVGKFGKIDGAIHAARVSETLTSNLKTRDGVNRVLEPTIRGLLVLEEVLRSHSPEFIVALSSTASLQARSGRIDRVAADCFLNAFAKSGHSRAVYVIDCDFLPSENLSASKQARIESSSLPDDEACASVALFDKAFDRFFSSSNLPPVVVCTRNEVTFDSGLRLRDRGLEGQTSDTKDIENQLCNWWQEFLGVDRVQLDDDFFDLGGHSLIGVQLLSEIKKNYGLDPGLSILFEARTVRQQAEYIRGAATSEGDKSLEWSPLVPIQPKGNMPPLFVISGLGGNVIKFQNLSVQLGENQPMYGLLPRGMDGKGSFHTRVEEIAADYVSAIRSTQPEGPYHLVGYSFGGIVAFEVAQQILAMGGSVALLGFFDTIEWHYLTNVNSSLSAGARLKSLYSLFRRTLFEEKGLTYLRKGLSSRLSRVRKEPAEPDTSSGASQLELIEQINASAARNYKPTAYPGKLTLFRSTKRVGHEGNDELLGWGELARGGVELHHVNSTHFDILREPAVIEVAKELRLHLATAAQ
jgi:thioesterase domain-containing protein/NAD(P)-dependent dehydrogenase (short-subunit alcohol dehydrogenase family)/acyl carrier protein